MDNLQDKLKATVLAAELSNGSQTKFYTNHAPVCGVSRKFWRVTVPFWAGLAAAGIALMVGIPMLVDIYRTPKDTFSDPAQAYAQLEQTFAYIGSKMDEGAQIAHKADASIDLINNVLAK